METKKQFKHFWEAGSVFHRVFDRLSGAALSMLGREISKYQNQALTVWLIEFVTHH